MSQPKGSWITMAVLAGVLVSALAFSSGAAAQTAPATASRLREVNRILENTAWGSYHTEFYPTYDYKATGIAAHEKAQ